MVNQERTEVVPTDHCKLGFGGSGHFVAGGMVTGFRVELF